MSEATTSLPEETGPYAEVVAALRGGTAPTGLELPPRDEAFINALSAALGLPGGDVEAAHAAFWEETTSDQDAFVRLRSRYARCVSQFARSDREWLHGLLRERLAAACPDFKPAGPAALWLGRFDEIADTLPREQVAEGRVLVALIGLLTTPASRQRPTGPLPVEAPPPAGRVYYVNGKEVRVTSKDDMLVNVAVGGTVGFVVFLFLVGQIVGNGVMTSPARLFGTLAVLAAVSGAGWVAYTRMNMTQRAMVSRFLEDIIPYWKLILTCLVGIPLGIGLILMGMPGLGSMVVALCGAILYGYYRLR